MRFWEPIERSQKSGALEYEWPYQCKLNERDIYMYIVANRVPVANDWAEEFEDRFRKRAGEIETQAGFVSMQILKPVSDGAPFVVLTTWEYEQVFQAWIKSEDFKLAHQNPMPKEAFSGKPIMERHEVVISTL